MMKARSILVIEDEDALRFGFSCYLWKKGCIVAEASCLAEARNHLASRLFDAIVLDVHLPDGNGLDYLTEVRGQSASLPVLIVSAVPLHSECLRTGPNFFFTKPVSMAQMYGTLTDLFNHQL